MRVHRHSLLRAALVAALLAARAAAEQEQGVAPVRRVIVSIPDRKLALLEDDRVVKVYDVAVGKAATPTPAGVFAVTNRVENPAWYRPGQVVAAGARNPVGTRWIGLTATGYGIHGTNAPKSIGKAASRGCIRMRNRDVEDLFARLRVGDTVELLDAVDEATIALFAPAEPSGVKAE